MTDDAWRPRDLQTIAVVGTGVIGRSWIRVFAGAGMETRVYDRDPAQLERALTWARQSADEDRELGLASQEDVDHERTRVRRCDSLAEALEGAGYVQESGPEKIETKQALYAELDGAAEAGAILGSSTSTHDMTRIAEGLDGAARCIVAHPTNPPHVVPVVEVLPGARTDPAVTETTLRLMREIGQIPVEMNRYAPGFLLNRLQGALVREAVSLVGSGVASVEAVDTCIRDGLGLRWALMGPFGTGHTNADGGVGHYYRLYGDAYRGLWHDLDGDPDFSDAVIDEIERGTVGMYGADAVEALCAWRNRMVKKIRALKEEDPPPGQPA